jgi:hypothetical protein
MRTRVTVSSNARTAAGAGRDATASGAAEGGGEAAGRDPQHAHSTIDAPHVAPMRIRLIAMATS